MCVFARVRAMRFPATSAARTPKSGPTAAVQRAGPEGACRAGGAGGGGCSTIGGTRARNGSSRLPMNTARRRPAGDATAAAPKPQRSDAAATPPRARRLECQRTGPYGDSWIAVLPLLDARHSVDDRRELHEPRIAGAAPARSRAATDATPDPAKWPVLEQRSDAGRSAAWAAEVGSAPRSYDWSPAVPRAAGFPLDGVVKWEREHSRAGRILQ